MSHLPLFGTPLVWRGYDNLHLFRLKHYCSLSVPLLGGGTIRFRYLRADVEGVRHRKILILNVLSVFGSVCCFGIVSVSTDARRRRRRRIRHAVRVTGNYPAATCRWCQVVSGGVRGVIHRELSYLVFPS